MLWIPLLAILAVINLIGCSNKEELPPTVTLEADKTTIKANGRDSLTFTVKVNGRVETRGVSVRTEAGESASATPPRRPAHTPSTPSMKARSRT